VNLVTGDAPGELVAREREYNLLGELRRNAASGRGGIALISGEAGIGKSALLRRFELGTGGGRSGSAFARCVEFIQTPLGPLRDLLQQVERSVSGPRDAAARGLIDRLAFEREADSQPAQPAGWLLESIDAAFARYAQRGTVVLLIEDVHWADQSTLKFLTYLADRIAARRMLVIATYRSDDVDGDQPRQAELAHLLAKQTVTQIALARLDERSTHALVEAELPHADALDAATVADVVRRSRGNPFFAEELLKSALERTSGDGDQRLPLSIRGAVLARASQLTAGERKILSLAAVLGERFSVERLVTLCEAGRDDVLLALERAQALHLVYADRGAPGELTFRHALTQEVLYGELLAERVRPLHEAIGLELESRPDPSAVSVELAHHWWRAGDSQRAARYAELAGDRALGIGALADAISYYERALAVHRDGSPAAGLEHKIGVALGSLGRFNAGIRRLRRAGDLYWRAGDFESFANNSSVLGAQLYNSGDPAGAIAFYRQAIEALSAKLPPATVDLLRARTAYNCLATLDADSAMALVSDIAEPIENAMTAAHAYQTRFKVAAMRGDLGSWRDYAAKALAAAQKAPYDPFTHYQVHCQIALDAVGLGEVPQARRHFESAALMEPGKLLDFRSLVYAASAFEHTLRGDFATAAALLARPGLANDQAYALQVHVKSANFVLGICTGDDARLRREDTESFLYFGVEHGMILAIGLVGGPHAWALGMSGATEEAAAWIHRIAKVLPGPHRFMFAFLAAAQYGRKNDVIAMRRLLAEAASRPQDRVNKAVLGLFDAFVAKRGLGGADARSGALEAAVAFEAIGWPWLAARGYELAGESKRALETYRAIGAVRDIRHMEVSPSAASGVLSPREREVGELVASGHSNDEIAAALHISSRTVEKHVSSALAKLNLRSRLQLGRLLAAEDAKTR
jgi:DNA-binding CsgD family transcriptional regulator/tetratricopeptide (TPR) repeat protein